MLSHTVHAESPLFRVPWLLCIFSSFDTNNNLLQKQKRERRRKKFDMEEFYHLCIFHEDPREQFNEELLTCEQQGVRRGEVKVRLVGVWSYGTVIAPNFESEL